MPGLANQSASSHSVSSWGTVQTPIVYPAAPYLHHHIPLPSPKATPISQPPQPSGGSVPELHPWLRAPQPGMHLDFQRVCRTLDSHIAECSNIHKHLNDPRLSMLDPATHPKAPSLSVLLGSPYDQNTWSVLPVVPTQGAPYVTVQDFIVTIVRYLQAVVPRQAREVWSGELRNVSKDAFSARTRGDPEAFRQGQKMVDIFGDHVVFAGLQPLSNGQLMLRAVKRH